MEAKTQTKILYVITKANFGGAQKYVFELADQAKKDGFDVSVATGGKGILTEKLNSSGIQTHTMEYLERDILLFNEIRAFFEMLRLFKKIKPDVVHLNSSKASAFGALAGRIAGVPKIIFTIHGWAFNENRHWFFKLLIKEIYFWTIALSHISIAVSENTKNQGLEILGFSLLKNKIKVIKNGIKEINFLSKEDAKTFFEKEYGVSRETFIVGTLSELHPIKGLDYLIKAVKIISEKSQASLDNMKFCIFGEGEMRGRLEKQISDLGLQNKVILAGNLPNGAKYLKGFDIFVLSSLSEAMPLSVIEAGFAGLPIIATNVGGISEIITNTESGLIVSPKDSEALADSILNILENPDRTRTFGEKIKTKVSTDFSFDQMYREIVACYN